ncbi:MAG TPA: hypothetical protein VK400_13290 [Pyrinomonadaceae bacterium]|nr:hypothetical protein [Pyrinomonadaceae bacterium]
MRPARLSRSDRLCGVILFTAVAKKLIAPLFIRISFAGADAAKGEIDENYELRITKA